MKLVIHLFILCLSFLVQNAKCIIDKKQLKETVHQMFLHGYTSYLKFANYDDELMPLSCKGRKRGVTPSRGNIDDALGNFSLTLVDSLDTLIVLKEFDEFEKAVRIVIDTVQFDSDLDVSVFEVNIRMIGGLISAHLMANILQKHDSNRMTWYRGELLEMAEKLGKKLLPAFNTTTGIPFSRVNLKYGITDKIKNQKNTCTACGGTMILEFAALSRLTGNSIFEEKAKKSMDFLWSQRHKESDLMGTVLNIHSGDWIRRESGIGAGIDSYYEYCLKAYILLGDEVYLHRFNKHYKAIMKYLNKKGLFINVHMDKPNVASRSFMDSLLAFWPGLQVLKGDIKPAIEMHEMLYLVMKKHKLIPEAFTYDFQVHWGQHLLRPEFIESTYFLYKATKDEHYLKVAADVVKSLNDHVKVKCGFAAIKDVRTMAHEDQMESFLLAETFKYLYMIFAEPEDLIFDPDVFVLTTEAHFLPLSIGESDMDKPRKIFLDLDEVVDEDHHKYDKICPYYEEQFKNTEKIAEYGKNIRLETQEFVRQLTSGTSTKDDTCELIQPQLDPKNFKYDDKEQLKLLSDMGITVELDKLGNIKFTHTPVTAQCAARAKQGLVYITEMMAIHKSLSESGENMMLKLTRTVQILSPPYYGLKYKTIAAPAQYGYTFNKHKFIIGKLELATPLVGCSTLNNKENYVGKIVVMKRGECMFQEKSRNAQKAGAIGVIVIDNVIGSSHETTPPFALAGDNMQDDDIIIPTVLLYDIESQELMKSFLKNSNIIVRIGESFANPLYIFKETLLGYTKI
ncbi:Edem2 [Strongyloides ratti]|uniref:alpha-1,2-Mannosidase n=1 Tax=Strongyloides ratti TaxID=34506 RepID=A0A090MVI7_STRRB|nr:Edem2 [Strongyloides ratti]CEF62933.1 Edem2 [Strongyloides ratti]